MTVPSMYLNHLDNNTRKLGFKTFTFADDQRTTTELFTTIKGQVFFSKRGCRKSTLVLWNKNCHIR